LARSHTKIAIKTLAGIAKDGTNESARVAAACALLDRGWGKPPQAHTGEDGEGAIQVTIRHLVEGMPDEQPPPFQIEAKPTERQTRAMSAWPRCSARVEVRSAGSSPRRDGAAGEVGSPQRGCVRG
jgi:hypothetical protein